MEYQKRQVPITSFSNVWLSTWLTWGFPDGTSVKNPPANAGDMRDSDSIPGLGRFPEEGHATHSSILARILWRILWTEEPGRLWSIGLKSQTRVK